MTVHWSHAPPTTLNQVWTSEAIIVWTLLSPYHRRIRDRADSRTRDALGLANEKTGPLLSLHEILQLLNAFILLLIVQPLTEAHLLDQFLLLGQD